MKFKTTLVATAVMLACQVGHAQTAQEVAAEMRQMREELRQLRAELDGLKKQKNDATASAIAAPVPSSANVEGITAVKASGTNDVASNRNRETELPVNAVNLFGYGELNFTRPRNNIAASEATARRAVLGFGYRFNDRTRFAAELEVENAVVSAGDKGEVAFEQLYVEHDFSERLSAKMGLFLLPIGYMNETHEPTRYYGVTRNLVETAIIPSTWRELGVGFRGTQDSGLRWDAGVVTSFDLNKWPTESAETKASPLGAIHQEGQLAKAASLAYYGALNFDGIPGVNFGGSLFQGGIGQKQATIASPNASVTLAELHTKWQVGSWDLSALAAQGRFHDVSAFNASGNGASNPVPDQFRGWYAQAAYRLWRSGDYSLVPFARYERVNTAVGFSGVFPGQVYSNGPENKVVTVGASYYLHPQVVVKMDVQKYQDNSALDRFNMGLGFHY
ncbi:hypothetical protein [Limnohabitans sp.]|uniref:hypothetical protein n=1 Tax=Limnohabitans sp. TaxID=1907725 RepID=UPI00286ED257|nr:hypothetical protein [Limnohabitans sp.]